MIPEKVQIRLKDFDWLVKQHRDHEKTITRIADDLGVNKTTVLNWCGRLGAET